jgi:hypothetical protein
VMVPSASQIQFVPGTRATWPRAIVRRPSSAVCAVSKSAQERRVRGTQDGPSIYANAPAPPKNTLKTSRTRNRTLAVFLTGVLPGSDAQNLRGVLTNGELRSETLRAGFEASGSSITDPDQNEERYRHQAHDSTKPRRHARQPLRKRSEHHREPQRTTHQDHPTLATAVMSEAPATTPHGHRDKANHIEASRTYSASRRASAASLFLWAPAPSGGRILTSSSSSSEGGLGRPSSVS